MSTSFLQKHFGISKLPTTLRGFIDYFRPVPDAPALAPRAFEYRNPAPASQPQYNPHVDKPISKDDYHLRDTRRHYPTTTVYSNAEIKESFLGSKEQIKNIEPVVILSKKYTYQSSDPDFAPSASNPDFTARALK